MQVYPMGLVVMLVWLGLALRHRDLGVALVGALIPFGMLNVFRLGGFSFIADDFCAAASFGLLAIFFLARRPTFVKIPISGIFLIFLAIYGGFASVFLIRLFAGSVDVFAFNRLYDGARVSTQFSGTVFPLSPGSANISQYAYLLLDIGFFFVAFAVGKSRGPGFLANGLRVGASINIFLGLVELAGGGSVLSVFKTAEYALLDDHSVGGFSRLTGGFAEASAYGAVSAALGAFFLTHGLIAQNAKDICIGLGSLAMAMLALSSSAIIGVAATFLFLGIWAVPRATLRFSPRLLYTGVLLSLVVGMIASMGLMTALADPNSPLAEIADRLIFSKSESRSGLERAAMARNGLDVFEATYGLGAGLGSVMANGRISAILASVGVPGMVLIVAFYVLCFVRPARINSQDKLALRRASQCFCFVVVLIAIASSFSVSPGLSTMYVAAISLSACNAVQRLQLRTKPKSAIGQIHAI
ncbi:MAG: hypothetical protein ABJH45_10070 [Paracoccaceae bacterium]